MCVWAVKELGTQLAFPQYSSDDAQMIRWNNHSSIAVICELLIGTLRMLPLEER